VPNVVLKVGFRREGATVEEATARARVLFRPVEVKMNGMPPKDVQVETSLEQTMSLQQQLDQAIEFLRAQRCRLHGSLQTGFRGTICNLMGSDQFTVDDILLIAQDLRDLQILEGSV
jgi:hypothetical protein